MDICSIFGTDDVCRQISVHIRQLIIYFKAIWRPSCLLAFKHFAQNMWFLKLGNITWILLSFSWGIFNHMMRSNQLHVSEILDESCGVYLTFNSDLFNLQPSGNQQKIPAISCKYCICTSGKKLMHVYLPLTP